MIGYFCEIYINLFQSSLVVVTLEMTFSGTMVHKQLTFFPWYDFWLLWNRYMKNSQCKPATIKKEHLTSGKNKAPLSPLSQFNKTYNK